MHAIPGLSTNDMQRNSIVSTSAVPASKLLKVITWQDDVADTEVLEQTGMSSVHTMLRRTSQLRWAGHITLECQMDVSRAERTRVSYEAGSIMVRAAQDRPAILGVMLSQREPLQQLCTTFRLAPGNGVHRVDDTDI